MYSDVSILGGGLAGLAAGIMARRAGLSVVLIEKKEYPFHKVCGEYISKESVPLLEWLGVPISQWQLPDITKFGLSHPSGLHFQSRLPLGGIGLSRFTLDQFLKNQLEKEGGLVLEGTKATGFQKIDSDFLVTTSHPIHQQIKTNPRIISEVFSQIYRASGPLRLLTSNRISPFTAFRCSLTLLRKTQPRICFQPRQ